MTFWRQRGWWNEFLARWQGRHLSWGSVKTGSSIGIWDLCLVISFLWINFWGDWGGGVGGRAGRRCGNGPIPWKWHNSRWVQAALLWWDGNTDVWQQFLTRQRMRSESRSCTGAPTWPINFNSNSPSSSCSGTVKKKMYCKMEAAPTRHNTHTQTHTAVQPRLCTERLWITASSIEQQKKCHRCSCPCTILFSLPGTKAAKD